MAALKPIRIGDTFKRKYRFYNPVLDGSGNAAINPVTKRAAPNYSDPVNLTGLTVVFIVRNGTNEYAFSGAKVAVTPLAGTVEVKLPPSDTALFAYSPDNSTRVELTNANGDKFTRAVQPVEIVEQWGIV